MAFITNLVLFQTLWFSCVLGAGAYGLNWLALAAVIPLAISVWFTSTRRTDYTLAVLAMSVGLFVDNIWVATDILAYPDHTFAPFWIALLWLGLGMTINHSMVWFRDHRWIGSIVVGAFAPVTYLTGQRFGAVSVNDLSLTVLISISWFCIWFGLSRYSHWLREDRDGTDRQLA